MLFESLGLRFIVEMDVRHRLDRERFDLEESEG
jgi:hypothetical protein